MELHFDWTARERWGYLEIIRSISEYFVNVNLHVPNFLCFGADKKAFRKLPGVTIEATFINKKRIKLYSLSRSYINHPLNFPGCPPTPDAPGSWAPRKNFDPINLPI
jgi:hypothetical protein